MSPLGLGGTAPPPGYPPHAAPGDYGMENMLVDPRWTTMGQYLGDSHDLLELERRAQMQQSKNLIFIS